MKPQSFEIRRAVVADIPFIMATERLPGYETLIGRWNEEQHRAAMHDGCHAYFVAELESQKVGFVLLRDWNSAELVTLIQRVAVAAPGKGHGRLLLAHLVERIFRDTGAYRICLGLYPHNVRARRAYEGVGFQAEGIARGSFYFGGVHHDELIMALLRPEWTSDRLAQIQAAVK